MGIAVIIDFLLNASNFNTNIGGLYDIGNLNCLINSYHKKFKT